MSPDGAIGKSMLKQSLYLRAGVSKVVCRQGRRTATGKLPLTFGLPFCLYSVA